ncbi:MULTISPECIES: DUF3319 domain-containing protein [Shewanella]|uniref:DUF3319 domain-containing protein n=2 Tax=Shewanella TaxID=22 RepID=B1KPU3_SHEWM|nr:MULTISPECIES: DUF3319 domain-containing protein [Shewanella]ACA87626.1 conserved hypothetical protein [Shewanella woodyi ATCC 51908]MBW8185551.1 DUF3319 domain-containing protein [Shewanella nanhaiensis]
MRKLIYQGFILTNNRGLTDSWSLSIGGQTRTGSLFELRRQINFYCELGVLPPNRNTIQTKVNATPLKQRTSSRRNTTK